MLKLEDKTNRTELVGWLKTKNKKDGGRELAFI